MTVAEMIAALSKEHPAAEVRIARGDKEVAAVAAHGNLPERFVYICQWSKPLADRKRSRRK